MSDNQTSKNQGEMVGANEIQAQNLRAYSACINCPHCGKIGFTRSEQTCNVLNFVFCCCCGECWFCHQLYKKKDLNCYDSKHTCSGCNKEIAEYKACM